jgi:hypothetical protein
MWDVVRFAEHHRYRAIVVENVVDAARWVMWPAWLHAMTLLGTSTGRVPQQHACAGGDGAASAAVPRPGLCRVLADRPACPAVGRVAPGVVRALRAGRGGGAVVEAPRPQARRLRRRHAGPVATGLVAPFVARNGVFCGALRLPQRFGAWLLMLLEALGGDEEQ